jgi:hypothetical protein
MESSGSLSVCSLAHIRRVSSFTSTLKQWRMSRDSRVQTHAASEDIREADVAKVVAEELQAPEAAHLGDLHGFAVADA